MKNKQVNAQDNAVNEQVNETQNPETTTAQGVQDANETDALTPEQQKAAAILKARLPKLAEAGLNFEKRSGNFFRASLAKVHVLDENGEPLEKNGQPVYELDSNGQPIEKVRRLVVDLNHESEAGTVETCIDEINAKRAAAMVVEGEKRRAKLEAEKAEAEKRVAECVEELNTFDSDMNAAIEIVNATELPERVSTPRIAVTAKLESMKSEMERMRAMLLAAGINPDEQE